LEFKQLEKKKSELSLQQCTVVKGLMRVKVSLVSLVNFILIDQIPIQSQSRFRSLIRTLGARH